jgi:chromosome segregation ATPase
MLLFAAAVALLGATVYAQDEPTLGDLARHERQQKAKSKTPAGKDAQPSKVITNEQISQHATEASRPVKSSEQEKDTPHADSADAAKQPAEYWTSRIQERKSQITSLQSQVSELKDSIQFAPANCVANCVAWNEHQKEKQQQLEQMQAQLDEQKKQLEEMQESARKQGYGSSVYDP